MTPATALVLCGGLGTRLRPVTGEQPKVLAEVAGRPFLHYTLTYLRSQGLRDIVLCTGYAAEAVAGYCQDGSRWGVRLRYSPEPEALGTGGAIKHALPLLATERCFVLNGDSLAQADLGGLQRFHTEKSAQISMVLARVSDKTRYGAALLADDGAVTGFSEKGQAGSGLINAGIYLLNREVLDTIPANCNVSLERDVFPRYAGRGLYGLVAADSFIDIGTPESFAQAQTVFAVWPH
jgi:NDP-sugar pyrophosphorylase family protein